MLDIQPAESFLIGHAKEIGGRLCSMMMWCQLKLENSIVAPKAMISRRCYLNMELFLQFLATKNWRGKSRDFHYLQVDRLRDEATADLKDQSSKHQGSLFAILEN
jgi:hypothetical protein